MKTFGQYGAVESVDIKVVNDGVAAYAFVVFVVSFLGDNFGELLHFRNCIY